MAATVVLYKSKYGSTRQYAEWIAADLKADVFRASGISGKKLKTYSTIVFGGGLYGNKISGLKSFVKHFEKLKDKKIIVFSCGLTDPELDENRKRILQGFEEQVPEETRESVKIFHLHGSIAYSKLAFYHRFMMKMLKKALQTKREEDLSGEEKNMMTALGKDHDFVERVAIKPIVEYVKQEK